MAPTCRPVTPQGPRSPFPLADFSAARHAEIDAEIAVQGEPATCHLPIDWGRIFPKGPGARPDAEALGALSREVDQLRGQGLQPWASLHQGAVPPALQAQGGWLKRSSIGAFADFARLMGEQLGDRVRHWITHIDPAQALQAPDSGSRALHQALQIGHHRLVSHGEAMRALRSAAPGAQIGIVLSLQAIRPASHQPADLAAALRQDGLRNRWWLDPLFGRGYPGDVLQALGVDAPTVLPGDLRSMASPCDFLAIQPQQQFTQASSGPQAELDEARVLELLERVHRDYQPPALYRLHLAPSPPRAPRRPAAQAGRSDGAWPPPFFRTERVSF